MPLLGSRTLVRELAHDLKFGVTVPYSVWFYKGQVIHNIFCKCRNRINYDVTNHILMNCLFIAIFLVLSFAVPFCFIMKCLSCKFFFVTTRLEGG